MKAMTFILTIGNINLSNKNVKSFEMDRNFSDVSNKFSLTLIDSPDVLKGTANIDITDLEILINEGHRSVSFSYTDSGSPTQYQTFRGTIWDYDASFVGDIKQLTVTGYASKSSSGSAVGDYFYNIDWNNYYNRRRDVTQPWNGLNQYAYKAQLTYAWEYANAINKDENVTYFLDSATSSAYFKNAYNSNSMFVKLQGPGGSINLPIPDTFTTMIPHRYTEFDDDGEPVESSDVGDVVDKDKKFWGALEEKSLKEYVKNHSSSGSSGGGHSGGGGRHDNTNDIKDFILSHIDSDALGSVAEDIILYVDKNGMHGVRGFSVDGGQTGYIQMNPNKSYFGAGQLLTTSTGVDPSHIVRQLAALEGWDVGNIVQTEYVPCSDAFKMQHQTAKQFITDVLIPLSITPVGEYQVKEDFYTYEEQEVTVDYVNEGYCTKEKRYVKVPHKKGSWYTAEQGQSGFVLYWRDGKVYYEPLSNSIYREHSSVTANIPLGYNVPNSPVISFKVNTKGTAFFTSPVSVKALDIVTGENKTVIVTSDKSSTESYNKVKGHNEALDNFFGYTYEKIRDKFGDASKATHGWVGLANETSSNGVFTSSLIQSGLVNRYANSALNSDTESLALAQNVKSRISKYMIQASMNLWGDSTISPGCKISVTNMIKSSNSNEAEVHPTSGVYLVYKQRDTFDGQNYTQQLSMYRVDDKPVNTYNVEFDSQRAVNNVVQYKTGSSLYVCPTPVKEYTSSDKKFSAETKNNDPYRNPMGLWEDAQKKFSENN